MTDMRIPEYFGGKNVLVTGATGSVGKALVEKLLRSCPDIRTMYLIIRPRRGEQPQDRWNKILESVLFEKLKTERPEVFSKVVVMPGDNVLDNYGLSADDAKILTDNVNIIYHGAANINFAEELRNAVLTNMKSTYSLCELAKNMRNLESFVHISTAYCNAHLNKGKTKEVISPPPMDWRAMVAIADNPKYSSEVSILEARLMSGHWTTYTLTKAMAENIVDEYSHFFSSTAIMRVSLVIGAHFEPEPGWTDSINPLSAICIGIRSGVLRVGLIDEDAPATPQIPLDICSRSLVIAPWYLHHKNIKQTAIFCCRMSTKNAYGSYDLRKYGTKLSRELPWKYSLYYPFATNTTNWMLFKTLFILLHFFPGLLVDKLLEIAGRKPMLLKIYRRYWKLTPMLKASVENEYRFSRENYLELDKSLLPEDRTEFTLDESNFYDKETWFRWTSICIMKHMSKGKEKMDEESAARNRRRLAWQRVIHVIVVICLGLLLASAVSFVFERSSSMKSLGPASIVVLYSLYFSCAMFTVITLIATIDV